MQKSYRYLLKGTRMSPRKLKAVNLFGVVALHAFDLNFHFHIIPILPQKIRVKMINTGICVYTALQ